MPENHAYREEYLNKQVEKGNIEDWNVQDWNELVVMFDSDYVTIDEMNAVEPACAENPYVFKITNLKNSGILVYFEI